MVISETKLNSKLCIEELSRYLLLYYIADLVLFFCFNERVSHCWFLLASSTNCFSVVLDLIQDVV